MYEVIPWPIINLFTVDEFLKIQQKVQNIKLKYTIHIFCISIQDKFSIYASANIALMNIALKK